MAGHGSLISFQCSRWEVAPTSSECKGSILLPCLLLLSLISLTALGFLSLTGTEIKISSAMDDGHQAKMATYSGKEIGLLRLQTDADYSGDTGLVFPDGKGSVDITVATSPPFERTVTSTGFCGKAQSEIQIKTDIYPRHFKYALSVAADFEMNKNSKILGDVYVKGSIKGETTALITGDVYLYGAHSILLDVGGKVISIDGQTVPTINGKAYDHQKLLPLVDWKLLTLRNTAQSQGQLYMSDQVFQNTTFTGVVFMKAGANAEFSDVTIRGVLVMRPPSGFSSVLESAGDAASTLTVKGGHFLKVISDPAVQEDVAIVAPASALKVEAGSYMDTLGCVVIGYGELASGSKAVVTGPTIAGGGVKCDGDIIFQSPFPLRDSDPKAVDFTEYELTEKEYSEK